MAKQGMKRPEITKNKPKNSVPPVPELQGAAKHTDKKANPVVAGTKPPDQKVYHDTPHKILPVASVYPNVDSDLPR